MYVLWGGYDLLRIPVFYVEQGGCTVGGSDSCGCFRFFGNGVSELGATPRSRTPVTARYRGVAESGRRRIQGVW